MMVKFCNLDDVNSPTRIAMVQGPPEQVQRATQMIDEIVEQVMLAFSLCVFMRNWKIYVSVTSSLNAG